MVGSCWGILAAVSRLSGRPLNRGKITMLAVLEQSAPVPVCCARIIPVRDYSQVDARLPPSCWSASLWSLRSRRSAFAVCTHQRRALSRQRVAPIGIGMYGVAAWRTVIGRCQSSRPLLAPRRPPYRSLRSLGGLINCSGTRLVEHRQCTRGLTLHKETPPHRKPCVAPPPAYGLSTSLRSVP